MSESRGFRGAESWLEQELRSGLRPVTAAPDLWHRIQEGGSRADRTPPVPLSWALLALLAVLAVGGGVWSFQRIAGRAPLDLATLTEAEINGLLEASGELDIRSADFFAIQNWIRQNSQLNLVRGSGEAPGGRVRILGARILRIRGSAVVLLAYLVGGHQNMLLVSGDRRKWDTVSADGHAFSRTSRLISWRMHDQNYAIAAARMQDAQDGCVLCHPSAVAAF
jgi:hypothetical protein